MRYLLPILLLLPSVVHGQQPTDFKGLVGILLDIISSIIPLIFALTLVVLIWGIVKTWILNAGNEAEVEKGKQLVVIGIVSLVIMSGIWGILAILRQSFFG
jgi:hypothetical protein